MMIPIITVFIIQYVLASMSPEGYSPEVAVQAKQIVNLINRERILQNDELYIINFDYLFQLYLKDYTYYQKNDLTQNSSTFTFSYNNLTYIRYDLGFFLMRVPYMSYWNRYGYKYIMDHSKNNSLKKILRNQRECYDMSACSKTIFTNYKTCVINNSDKCRNAHLQYARLFSPSFSRIAYIDSNNRRYYYGRLITNYVSDRDYPLI